MRWSKYGNRKTYVGGKAFDSAREANRYTELYLMQKAGKIQDLQCQVSFELVPGIKSESGRGIQRPITYVADFTYREDDRLVVEDAKGYRTEVYNIKKKLMRWRHGIEVREV